MSSQDGIEANHVWDRGVRYCLLEDRRPAGMSCNKDRTRLNQLIKMLRMDWEIQAGVLEQNQTPLIQDDIALGNWLNIKRLHLYVDICWVKRVKIFLWENIYKNFRVYKHWHHSSDKHLLCFWEMWLYFDLSCSLRNIVCKFLWL